LDCVATLLRAAFDRLFNTKTKAKTSVEETVGFGDNPVSVWSLIEVLARSAIRCCWSYFRTGYLMDAAAEKKDCVAGCACNVFAFRQHPVAHRSSAAVAKPRNCSRSR
jgi:hypothetical protein